jgi:hypothetical protein
MPYQASSIRITPLLAQHQQPNSYSPLVHTLWVDAPIYGTGGAGRKLLRSKSEQIREARFATGSRFGGRQGGSVGAPNRVPAGVYGSRR